MKEYSVKIKSFNEKEYVVKANSEEDAIMEVMDLFLKNDDVIETKLEVTVEEFEDIIIPIVE